MSYIGKQPTKAPLTASDIEDGIITAAKIEDGAVVAAEIASNAVTTAKINADAVTAAKIADDVINSEHIVADSIDAEHYAAGSVDTTALGADAVTGAKIADDAINSEHYTDGSIDTAHIADGQVTTAKLASAVFTGATDIGADLADADLILVDDGAGGTIRKAALSRVKTYAGGVNTPAFQARNGSDQDIGYTGNFVKITCNTEIFDTDSKYDNSSNYRFTPTVAGKYFCYGSAIFEATATSNNGNNLVRVYLAIYKNGSAAAYSEINRGNQDFAFKKRGEQVGAVLDLDADDYIELYAMADSGVAGSTRVAADAAGTYFGAYKIIT